MPKRQPTGSGKVVPTASVETPVPLCTPFEAAQLAVSLAMLNGEKEPDLEGAVALLRQAAIRVHVETRPVVRFPRAAWFGSWKELQAARPTLHPSTVPMCPESHPVEFATWIEKLKSEFPSLAAVRPPKKYPATHAQVFEALLGKRNPNRAVRLIVRLWAAQPSMGVIKKFPADNVFQFWSIAQQFAPYIKRNKPSTRAKNSLGRFKRRGQ